MGEDLSKVRVFEIFDIFLEGNNFLEGVFFS